MQIFSSWTVYAIIAVAILYVLIEIVYELNTFVITRYKITSKKLDSSKRGIKIAYLSDMHNHEYGKDNNKLLNAIKSERPDVIILGGDMIVAKNGRKDYEHTLEFVKKLPEIAPVYYGCGNHEKRMREQVEKYGNAFEIYTKALEEAGVIYLENGNESFECNGQQIEIAGIDLPTSVYRRPRNFKLAMEEITACNPQLQTEKYQILMAHHPDYAKLYREWGADLTLAGHFHGGVARLPKIGGIISPQIDILPRYSGDCYQVDGGHIVVSKGLGTHTVNLRFWNRAELIMIQLDGEEGK